MNNEYKEWINKKMREAKESLGPALKELAVFGAFIDNLCIENNIDEYGHIGIKIMEYMNDIYLDLPIEFRIRALFSAIGQYMDSILYD